MKNPLKQPPIEVKKNHLKWSPISGENKSHLKWPAIGGEKKKNLKCPPLEVEKLTWINLHWGQITHHQQWKESD